MPDPPEPFKAPHFEVRDDDPIGPERLRNLQLDAEKAIRAWDVVARIARDPAREPGYSQIHHALMVAFQEADSGIRRLTSSLEMKSEMAAIARYLPMDKARNVEMLDGLESEVIAMRSAIHDLGVLREQLRKRAAPAREG